MPNYYLLLLTDEELPYHGSMQTRGRMKRRKVPCNTGRSHFRSHSLVYYSCKLRQSILCSANGTKYAETRVGWSGRRQDGVRHWRSAVLWLGPSWGDYGTTSGDQDKSPLFLRPTCWLAMGRGNAPLLRIIPARHALRV